MQRIAFTGKWSLQTLARCVPGILDKSWTVRRVHPINIRLHRTQGLRNVSDESPAARCEKCCTTWLDADWQNCSLQRRHAPATTSANSHVCEGLHAASSAVFCGPRLTCCVLGCSPGSFGSGSADSAQSGGGSRTHPAEVLCSNQHSRGALAARLICV